MMPTSLAGRNDVIAILGVTVSAVSITLLNWPQAAWAIGLGWLMVGIGVSDARRFIVPDCLSLPAIPIGLLAAANLGTHEPSAVLAHVFGMLMGAVSFYSIQQAYVILRARQGLGGGDVKLAATAGAWVGIEGLLSVVLAASLSALAFAISVMVKQKLRKSDRRITGQTAIPFGAFLAPAIWLVYVIDQT